MDTVAFQIQQIRAIRALRVGARRREHQQSKQALLQAEQAVQLGKDHVATTEQQALTFQRDGLASLLSDKLVNIERLETFQAQKLQGIHNIRKALEQVDTLESQRAQASSLVEEKAAIVQHAEKRLLGIEEVLERQLWK